MKLTGSCHCGKVQFSINSPHPYPFNFCYCSICRKTAGGGGYAINLGAEFAMLEVSGRECISVCKARIKDEDTGEMQESPGERSFCRVCASDKTFPHYPEECLAEWHERLGLVL